MNYVLGPMKCSGKQQLYPPDVERLNKQIKEQKLIDIGKKITEIDTMTKKLARAQNLAWEKGAIKLHPIDENFRKVEIIRTEKCIQNY